MLSFLRRLTSQARTSTALVGCGGALAASYVFSRPSLCEARSQATSTDQAPAAPSLASRCVAEAIGTGIIIAGGCGAVCSVKYAASNKTLFGLAACWGASVALAVYITRAVSGAHLNPAVTLALTAIGKAPVEEAAPYISAQCLGAFLAAAANYAIFAAGIAASEASANIIRGSAASTASFAGAFGMVPNTALLGVAGAFVAEVWMTAILMFVILGIGDEAAGSVPAAAQPALVGATVTTLICTFGPVTGCGMNPARDLGPRLVTLLTGWGTAATTAWYVYTFGPVAGAVLGALAYEQIMAPQTKLKAK